MRGGIFGGIFTRGTTGPTVAAGGTIPLGETVHRFGCGIDRNGDSITLAGGRGRGWYAINGTVTLTPEATGTATVTLLSGGVAVSSSSMGAATGSTLTLPVAGMVRSGCDAANVTLSLGGVAASIGSVSLVATAVS